LNKHSYLSIQKALEEPHHNENCDNVSSRTDDIMPDSRRGSLCTRSEVDHFESVESEKEITTEFSPEMRVIGRF